MRFFVARPSWLRSPARVPGKLRKVDLHPAVCRDALSFSQDKVVEVQRRCVVCHRRRVGLSQVEEILDHRLHGDDVNEERFVGLPVVFVTSDAYAHFDLSSQPCQGASQFAEASATNRC